VFINEVAGGTEKKLLYTTRNFKRDFYLVIDGDIYAFKRNNIPGIISCFSEEQS
jgi:hypothetical protein